MAETAITPTRTEDFPEWYQQIIRAADLAETSVVRGCMVIRPWGYGIWESLQRGLDQRIKATGHENAYFPLFIPLSFLEREAEHVEGFAKECAVVTHHRLEQKDGKLVPAGELEEPLIIRPTSETIIGESFSKWVESYRDLPLLINQWANVVRWEMRTRVFLRTTEFLWQEGHTVHATAEEAVHETRLIAEMYREFLENVLAIPVISGEKTEGERFPGAVTTISVEAMMQDRKALQAGTSHFLGQNFAKSSNIKFLNTQGVQEYAYTTSWGVSTRLIGALIMAHGDDNGMRVPPRVSPKHAVIIPVIPNEDARQSVLSYAEEIAKELCALRYNDSPVVVHIDRRDMRGGDKSWEWIKRGVPIRIEVGPRDITSGGAMVYRRDQGPRDKRPISRAELASTFVETLDSIQANYFAAARKFRDENITSDIKNFDELTKYFTPKNEEKPEIHGGFVRGKWAGDGEAEAKLSELKVSIRCIPEEQSGTSGTCIVTGKKTTTDAIFAKSY